MSKIIKAAELKVLVANDTQTVIPAAPLPDLHHSLADDNTSTGTILDATNLIEDAQRKAGEILAEAEEMARNRMQEVEQELESLRLKAKESGFSEGYHEGYEEGLARGRDQAREEAVDLLATLEKFVEEAVKVRATNLAALEDDFLKLSLLLADKIVRKTVENDISWLQPIIKDALTSLGQVDEVVVLLSPLDYALLQEHEDDLQIATRTKLTFDQDQTITQGGCLIESESGLIDARLESRLGKLAHHLLEVLYYEND
ncbi:MAG: hypothetical protein GX971_00645 [Firmicutes bacterium]|nr:hypothetical protein [Bacillota bacterium]